MIFTSVDLPAPLSPISPSTSPRPRCMETSSSARTAPNRFEMCSTRIASSASRPLPESLIWPPPEQAEVLQPLDLHIQDHRTQDRDPDDQVEVECADAEDREADVQDGEHADAEEAADDRARPAHQRRAADDRCRDGEEHDVRAALQRQDRRDPSRVQDSREAAEHAAEHEVADLDPADVDAALSRADRVAARRDRVEAPARPDEHDLQHHHGEQRPPELRVEPERIAAEDLPERVAARRLHLEAVQGPQVDPVQEEQHAERRDERGHAEVGRDQPVRETDGRGGQEAEDHPQPDRQAEPVGLGAPSSDT